MAWYQNDINEKLCAAMREDREAHQWMTDNGYRELAEFCHAINGDEKSFQWLLHNGHPDLAAVVDCMTGNDHAKKWLLVNGYRELAAFVDASEGAQPAISFLLQIKEYGLVDLAKIIFQQNQKQEKNFFKSIINFGNPFR